MRMALKAQSQCRATLETLANIKNPTAALGTFDGAEVGRG
jgi:hypothetical protein